MHAREAGADHRWTGETHMSLRGRISRVRATGSSKVTSTFLLLLGVVAV